VTAPGHDALDAALATVHRWPVANVAATVLVAGQRAASIGDERRSFRLASVSKLLTAYAVLIAVEEGVVALDDTVGQPGCTVRHLLAHAGGYAFDGPDAIAVPGRKRIYSNTGYELLADHVAAACGFEFAVYVREAVLDPLGMADTDPSGSPAKDFRGPLGDLGGFVAELVTPTLVDPATWAEATSPQFPELEGIVPGVGRFSPCPWGLGPELRGLKHPHWTGNNNSPATFGHFGGAGTFIWVDPVAGVALAMLADREFDEWALHAWPDFSDGVLDAAGARGHR